MTILKPKARACAAVLAVCGLAAPLAWLDGVQAQTAPRVVVGVLEPTQGNTVEGAVTFLVTKAGRMRVSVALTDLAPNSVHGFHIHERGDCSAPDASSAGGHFDPYHTQHGGRTGRPRHIGDLGNVTADANGQVLSSFVVDGITIGNGPADIVGKAVVVHAGADDLRTQPSGSSGARIACGVIQRHHARAPQG